jgi:hypothetical protein
MTRTRFDGPEYFRDRAQEAVAKVEQMFDPVDVRSRAEDGLLHPCPIIVEFSDRGVSKLGRVTFAARRELDDQHRRGRPCIPIAFRQPQDTTNLLEGRGHDLDLFRLKLCPE